MLARPLPRSSSPTSTIRQLLVESSKRPDAEVIVADGVTPDTYPRVVFQITDGAGFDDIVVLALAPGGQVTEAARAIGFRGTMNLVGTYPLDSVPGIDTVGSSSHVPRLASPSP